MSGTQQAASHVHHAGSRASDVAPKQFYVTTRGSCLHLRSRASYRWRQFWKVPRDLRLQPFSICPAWADEDQIQASSRQGLRKTAMPKPSARAVNKRQPTLPASLVDSEAIHDDPAEGRQRGVGGCTWLEAARDWRLHVAGDCKRWAACGRRLCAATPWMIGRARLEAIRGGPVDDGRARLEAVRGGPVNDGRARLEAGRGSPTDDRPRAVGGYARLELMHGFEIWGVGGPSFPQVEASTKWSL